MLSLRVHLGDSGGTKALRFPQGTLVWEAVRLVVEKTGVGDVKTYGLWMEATKKWLKGRSTLEENGLVNGDEVVFKCTLHPMKISLPDGTVKTMMVDLTNNNNNGNIGAQEQQVRPPDQIAFLSSKDWQQQAVLRSLSIKAIVAAAGSMESFVEFVFQNPHSTAMEAVFQFRGAESTIWGFEVLIHNRRIRSECHERAAGVAKYDDAISSGARAAILEQNHSTTSLSIGNLEAGASCSVTLRLMHTLERDRVTGAWKIEMALAALIPQAADSEISIAFWDQVKEIECPSRHAIRVSTAGPHTVIAFNKAEAPPLEQELVISFRTEDALEKPLPLVELSDKTAALRFSFVPRFGDDDHAAAAAAASDVQNEIIFLVDRSGSMAGSRMQGAINALQAMVRSLPVDSYFQIVSFGSEHEALFADGISRSYTEESLALASEYIAKMEANMGGTEIQRPLLHILAPPEVGPTYVRHVVVLTDGEVGSVDKLATAVHSACQGKRVTISTVGIGVATQPIRALVYRGLTETVDERAADRIEARVALLVKKLLQGARTMMARVQLEWDADIKPLFVTPGAVPMLWSGDSVSCSAIVPAFEGTKTACVNLCFENGPVQKYEVRLDAAQASRGVSLHRMICSSLMRELDARTLDASITKDQLVPLAVSLSVLTRHTVLVAVDEVVENEYGKDPVAMLPKRLVIPTSSVAGGTGSALIDSIGVKLGLPNAEEYGIQLENGRWLNPNLSLAEQGVNESTKLNFKKRFFCDDLNVDKSDPIQLSLIFQQSRDSVVSANMPVTPDEAVRLASLQLQCEIGNYDPAVHNEAWWKAQAMSVMPQSMAGHSSFQDVAKEWRKLVNMNKMNSTYRYVQQVRQSPTYGITTFEVRDKTGPQLMGVTRDAVVSIDPVTKQVIKSYPLKHIRRWAAGNGSFTLDFGTYESNYVTVATKQGEEMSELLSGHIDILLKRQREGRSQADVDEGELAKIEDLPPFSAVPLVAKRVSLSGKDGKAIALEMLKTVAAAASTTRSSSSSPPRHEESAPVLVAPAAIEMEREQAVSQAPAPAKPQETLSLNGLIALQKYRGNWVLDERFAQMTGFELTELQALIPKDLDGSVWATAIAVAILKTLYHHHKVEWELLVGKAVAYIQEHSNNTMSPNILEDLAIHLLSKKRAK